MPAWSPKFRGSTVVHRTASANPRRESSPIGPTQRDMAATTLCVAGFALVVLLEWGLRDSLSGLITALFLFCPPYVPLRGQAFGIASTVFAHRPGDGTSLGR